MKNRNIQVHIPVRKIVLHNSLKKPSKIKLIHFTVERFFEWLKNRYRGLRIHYARNSDNYLEFMYLTSILKYGEI